MSLQRQDLNKCLGFEQPFRTFGNTGELCSTVCQTLPWRKRVFQSVCNIPFTKQYPQFGCQVPAFHTRSCRLCKRPSSTPGQKRQDMLLLPRVSSNSLEALLKNGSSTTVHCITGRHS